MYWVFAGSTISKIAAIPLGLALLHGPLDQRDTWVIGHSPAAPQYAQRLSNADSLAGLKRNVQFGHGIVLDLEHWRFTPREEQAHPAKTYKIAARWAMAHGAWLVETPALDLFAPPRIAHYLHSSITRWVSAEAFDIQAQGLERNPRRYARFVHQVTQQLRAYNPSVIVLAGLSNNPGGAAVTPKELLADYRATHQIVNGYWLDVPSPGRYCPNCSASNPRLAVWFLHLVLQ